MHFTNILQAFDNHFTCIYKHFTINLHTPYIQFTSMLHAFASISMHFTCILQAFYKQFTSIYMNFTSISQTFVSFCEKSKPGSSRGPTGVQPGSNHSPAGVQPGSHRGPTGVQPGCNRGPAGAQPGSNRGPAGVQPESGRSAVAVETWRRQGPAGVRSHCNHVFTMFGPCLAQGPGRFHRGCGGVESRDVSGFWLKCGPPHPGPVQTISETRDPPPIGIMDLCKNSVQRQGWLLRNVEMDLGE